mgnify:FL=1
MKKTPTRVLLTGASGNWGRATLREFATRADTHSVTALALPTERDKAVLAEFEGMGNLDIVWGDLTDYATVAACVAKTDIVLHVGAVVSPVADEHPELAQRVNVGSMRNIIKAVRSQSDPAAITVVGIGSVAETGNRNPPFHWGRVGDPIRVSRFDQYGQSKVIAERELVDSGLPRWVWLRQTGIFHPGMLEIRDPIMTHSPFAGVMEWVSADDSARLLARLCEEDVPDTLWGGIYNIGGGHGWRLTNWQLQTTLGKAMGVSDIRKWYERNWFALKNFHGQWYTDSDVLNDLIPFREDTFETALSRSIAALPRPVRSAGKVPAWIIKHFIMKPLTHQPRGTMAAIRSKNPAEISAHFGSHEAWKNIGDWSTFEPRLPSQTPSYLDHGYDENKSPSAWSARDYRDAATYRGGKLLSTDVQPGDVSTPLVWICGLGHQFSGSPRLILKAGHWCPTCVAEPAGYERQAEDSRFLAQVVNA